jgi:hypothetical protein
MPLLDGLLLHTLLGPASVFCVISSMAPSTVQMVPSSVVGVLLKKIVGR